MKGYKDEISSVNFLHKKFPFLQKNDIKLIYQFCDSKIPKTQKILMILKDIKNPKCVTQVLLQKPEKAEAFLAGIQCQYEKKYGHIKNTSHSQNQMKMLQDNELDFFYYMPHQCCLSVMKFLDPYSFYKLSMTCQKLYQISLGNGCSDYYRILCVNLFEKYRPQLPQQNRYQQVRRYVQGRPNQFGPNTRNAVRTKVRYYVWQFHPVPTQQQPNYYQKFGSYKQIYLNCPRVHFNGFYMCKHQYRKQEDNKDILKTNSTVHLVTYYRYIRFFADGSVLCSVLPKKLKQNQILELLASENITKPTQQLEQMKQLMLGEYLHEQNKVSVKAVKSGTIFNYELQILPKKQNDNMIGNQLLVRKYWIKVIDENDIIQNLQESKDNNGLKFRYLMHPTIAKQNSKLIRASSL